MAIEKQHLETHFELKRVSCWTALHPKSGFELKGFRTAHLAKLFDSNMLHFTIGATKLGEKRRFNETIRAIINGEGIPLLLSTDLKGK